MIPIPPFTRRAPFSGALLLLPALALFLLIPGTSRAQGLRLYLSDKEAAPPKERQFPVPLLRPNVTQDLYLYVESNDGQKSVVTVQVMAGDKPIDGGVKEIELSGKGAQRVNFPPVKPPAPGAKPVPPAEVVGAKLRVVLLKDGKILPEPQMKIEIGRPSEYVQTEPEDFDPASRRLSLTVLAKDRFFGPRSRVELDLRPARLPFLSPRQKQVGSYGGYVNRPNDPADKLKLTAEALVIIPVPPEALRKNPAAASGLFSITVDDYDRAFTYRISPEDARPTALENTAIRLVADPAAASGPGAKVGIEADNIPDDADIELGLYRDKLFTELDGKLLRLSGDRQQHLFFTPSGPNGALSFRTEVADWKTEIETAKIFGDRFLRLWLVNRETGKQLVNRDTGKPVEFLQVLANGQTRRVDQITSNMMLDGSPPEDVKFVDFPKELTRGSPLTLKATGHDPESDISKVVFFAGKLPPDRVIPPAAVQAPGEKLKDKPIWVADLPVATEKAATIDVGVQFTNGVGQTETVVAVIKLVDAKPAGATIKGSVVEGEQAQAGLEVMLRDPQGAVKDTVKTDEAGKFVFKNVAPGTYQLVASKSSSRRLGQAVVKVEAGDEKELMEPIKLVR